MEHEYEHDAPRRLWTLPSWLVNRVALQAGRLVAERLGDAGVRRKHFSVLATLEEFGPMSQAAIGRRLALDRSDLHAIVGDLERDGLIARARDASDRRRNTVALTPKGKAALKRLDARVRQAQDELLAPLSSKEREQLVALLTRVVEHHAAEPKHA
ncbi:MarR family winged helix-turn-helix transcriptional regulator [Baekduia sp. Peel2402]|uniref:MarR family winged helix-turn-helix transcriptional regulator n=1 Tax=Baekduia sp. Peel2402 TaxID=3458296 RepID=UPI00403E499F